MSDIFTDKQTSMYDISKKKDNKSTWKKEKIIISSHNVTRVDDSTMVTLTCLTVLYINHTIKFKVLWNHSRRKGYEINFWRFMWSSFTFYFWWRPEETSEKTLYSMFINVQFIPFLPMDKFWKIYKIIFKLENIRLVLIQTLKYA